MLLIFIVLYIFSATVFYVLGFLCATPIALICARAARRNGLDAGSYARLGALYSVMNIGLGIYLLRRLQGIHISSRTISVYYAMFFSIWLVTSVICAILAVDQFVTLYDYRELTYFWGNPDRIQRLLAVSVIGLIGLPVCIASLVHLIAHRFTTNTNRADTSDGDILPARSYILPFVFYFVLCTVPSIVTMYRSF